MPISTCGPASSPISSRFAARIHRPSDPLQMSPICCRSRCPPISRWRRSRQWRTRRCCVISRRTSEAIRHDVEGTRIELPVKLKVYDSLFVPLAKWSMLIAGNYRCVQPGAPRSIRDAVHSDIGHSQAIYNWVSELCRRLGAVEADQVPFEKYAAAARQLQNPSSVARALLAGAVKVERVDRLVHRLAASKGMSCQAVDAIVALVDAKLQANRAIAAASPSVAA